MVNKLIKFLLFLLTFLILIILYLSFFGISTKQFNNKINSEILNINKRVNLKLKKVSFLLNPYNFSINIKTSEPKVFFDKNELKLESIKTNISIKSLFNKDLTIDDLKVSTKEIKVKNIILLARSFRNSPELFVLDNIVKEGFLIADINLNFDKNGIIRNDYKVNGYIRNTKLSLPGKYNVKDLNLLFQVKNNEYTLENIETNFNQIQFSSSLINIKKTKNIFLVKGKLKSKKKEIDLNLLTNIFIKDLKFSNIKNIDFSSDNNFSFSINKNFKINDLIIKSKIYLNKLKYTNTLSDLKKYLPSFNESIELIDHEIAINYSKNKIDITGNGNILIDDKIDLLNYKITKKDNNYIFNTDIKLKNNSLLIDILNYKKEDNLESTLSLSGIFENNKNIKINELSLKENKNRFLIKDLILSRKFKILSFDILALKFINDNKIENQLTVKRSKKNYTLSGKAFDATSVLDKIFDESNDKSFLLFSDDFNTNIIIKIDKFYLDNEYFVRRVNGNIGLRNNDIEKMDITSFFDENKKLTITVNNNLDEKITTVYSDYARPFVKKFKFIKGFQEGSLDFYSVKKDKKTKSLLKIYDFKLNELPALTKILTLASLQGIADLLSGEGIRFSDFEMSYTTNAKLTTIHEIYAIGPAISILIDGYVESGKLVSLDGTLVPATTINKVIGSIPIIGNILVGEKVGDGVFGVSFKIKGHPKKLKTTVNPIKTLTPRFITRTLEKIKTN